LCNLIVILNILSKKFKAEIIEKAIVVEEFEAVFVFFIKKDRDDILGVPDKAKQLQNFCI
jgi:hypothetical protein